MNKPPIFILLSFFLVSIIFLSSPAQAVVCDVTAASGYWQDIQNAVNQVAATGGNVCIPQGTFNFVNVGEAWTGARVTIPAGVNLFGAPTQRDANNQVIEWNTVLIMPWDVPGSWVGTDDPPPWGGGPRVPTWFGIDGNGSLNKPSRFSDIKLVGYRSINPESKFVHSGLEIQDVVDWRVDHSYFENIPAGMSVSAGAYGPLRGVFDHNRFINTHGYVYWYVFNSSVGYGIGIGRSGREAEWEDNTSKVFGQYTNSTVIIEDSYFSRWRHVVSSNDGVHFVFRFNTIEKDSVVGSLDGHGTYNHVGTRAMEFYNNTIVDPIKNFGRDNWNSTTPADGVEGYTVNWRGGGGVFFDNYIRNYRIGLFLVDEGLDLCWECRTHDIWIWSNNWVNVPTNLSTYSDNRTIEENIDYFLRAPSQAQDGWTYIPYPYPHPLTLENIPTTKLSGRLLSKLGSPLNAKVIAIQQGVIIATNQTANGYYSLTVPSGIYDLQFNFTSIPNYYIKLLPVNLSSDRTDILNYLNYSTQRVSFTVDINDSQMIETYSSNNPSRILKNGTLLQNVSSYSQLISNTWFFNSSGLYMLISPSVPVQICSDGTTYGQCSATKPLYCENGDLINKCSVCGCSAGQNCNTTNEECHSLPPAYIFEDGFESGDFSTWTGTSGTPTVVSSQHHQGTYSAYIGTSATSIYKNLSSYSTIYMRAWVYFGALPTSSGGYIYTISLVNSGQAGYPLVQAIIYHNGTAPYWYLRNGYTGSQWATDAQVQPNTWYNVEIKQVNGGAIVLYINDVQKVAGTGTALNVDRAQVGQRLTAGNYYTDDVVVSNSYIGP